MSANHILSMPKGDRPFCDRKNSQEQKQLSLRLFPAENSATRIFLIAKKRSRKTSLLKLDCERSPYLERMSQQSAAKGGEV